MNEKQNNPAATLQPVVILQTGSALSSIFAWVFPQGFFADVARLRQPKLLCSACPTGPDVPETRQALDCRIARLQPFHFSAHFREKARFMTFYAFSARNAVEKRVYISIVSDGFCQDYDLHQRLKDYVAKDLRMEILAYENIGN